jgi:hypothetical protein
MDDHRLNPAAPPGSARWNSWTSRIILWTLASVVGLWLGTGARTAAAGGQASRPSRTAQAAIADVFRFDILLAGKESPAEPVRPKAPTATQYNLPAAVLLAMEQRPEPVPSVMPKTLSSAHPRFMFAPPARPAGPWRMKWDGNMAHLEHAQQALQAALAMVPDLNAADRKSIQIEVDKACEQIGTLRMQQADHAPGPPEPPVRLSGPWSELGTQLMP